MTQAREIPRMPLDRDPRRPFDPAPELYRMRDDGPVTLVMPNSPEPAWLITGYDDQRALLADHRMSSNQMHPGFPVAVEGIKQSQGGGTTLTIFGMDNPRHDVLRRLYAKDFMVKKINQLRPLIQKHVDDLIDKMLAGPKPVDFVAAFALALPTLVVSDVLGIPYEDQKFFQEVTAKIVDPSLPGEVIASAVGELGRYINGLLEIKLKDPKDDMLSRLAAFCDAGEITREEAVGAGMVLIPAGHETTANMTTMSTIVLLRNPGQLDQIRDGQNTALIANAVEELLRYIEVPHYGRRRVALEDIEIAGRTIHKGEGVILPGNIADREPGIYEGDPDKLDIHREARHHLAFGYGIHQCLGQPLARAELQIILATLFRRIPTLELAVPVEKVEFRSDLFIYGAHRVLVTW
jgi:cytochrome P450